MSTFILFIYGVFEDIEDVEFFCMDVLGESKSIDSLKYVIGNEKNIIVIFDTKKNETEIANELATLLDNESVLFYFMFNKTDIVLSHIPENIKNLIFKPSTDIMKIEFSKIDNPNKKLNLDDILEKIERQGINSLTEDEKKFLDNFEK